MQRGEVEVKTLPKQPKTITTIAANMNHWLSRLAAYVNQNQINIKKFWHIWHPELC